MSTKDQFNLETLSFRETWLEEAVFLLRPVLQYGRLGTQSSQLPANLATLVGQTCGISVTQLRGYLSSFHISEIAGGSHSPNSRHYAGVAADINIINGRQVSSSHPDARAFQEKCRDLGATEVRGPGNPGHDTYVHTAWPRPL